MLLQRANITNQAIGSVEQIDRTIAVGDQSRLQAQRRQHPQLELGTGSGQVLQGARANRAHLLLEAILVSSRISMI